MKKQHGFTQHYKNSAGFTLIELLVVIAIIGVLSAVVLAALNTARSKGNDAAVRSNLVGIRSQAQLYFDDNKNYGPVSPDVVSDCAATDNLFNDPNIKAQVAAAVKANVGAGIICNVAADGTAYAVSAALVATPGTYYCVDSVGSGKTSNTALGTNTGC